MGVPKSLTATIHVRFHYKEPEPGQVIAGETKLIDELLVHAGDMAPELQDLLLKFAKSLRGNSGDGK